jgi:hypothetical protein
MHQFINFTTMLLNIDTRTLPKARKRLLCDLLLLIQTLFAGDSMAEALELLVVGTINCFQIKKSVELLQLSTVIRLLAHLYVLIFYKELYFERFEIKV